MGSSPYEKVRVRDFFSPPPSPLPKWEGELFFLFPSHFGKGTFLSIPSPHFGKGTFLSIPSPISGRELFFLFPPPFRGRVREGGYK